ncbi:hypothetical protein EYF80_040888 [Liparis tanakae]|uniref:Uncharacterized protein n=1 Tax=Liparis tanakae TaxID=230148 RepID=A0A4Z2G5Q2_9TELE|nr:hypothetical protein EYF80_040888 [Liparis tanakae]
MGFYRATVIPNRLSVIPNRLVLLRLGQGTRFAKVLYNHHNKFNVKNDSKRWEGDFFPYQMEK